MMELTDADVLENEYLDNVKTIKSLQERNINIIISLVKLYYGISVGDVVTHKGNKYLVSRIDTDDWISCNRTHKPWIWVHAIPERGICNFHEFCLYSEWERKV